MEQFNNNIVVKLAEYISDIMDSVSQKDDLGRTVKLVKYEAVAIDNFDISYLQSNGLTAQRSVFFYFDILNEEGRTLLDQLIVKELVVPVLVNGSFYIEGKVRTSIQTLNNSYECRIDDNWIRIDRELSVNKTDDGYIVSVVGPDGDMLEFDQIQIAQAFKNNSSIIDSLRLTEVQQQKLQIKLDVDKVGDYLTPKLIEDLFKLPSDRLSDNIIDKSVMTAEGELIAKLHNWSKRKNIVINISNKFFKYDNIYLTDIQKEINNYFKIASDEDISIPDVTNPLSYDSLRYRLVMPRYVAYNETMTDLIDPIYTPENNNVNRINYLNVCTSIKGEDIYIKCKDTKGTTIEMPYLKYLNTPVLVSDYFDYLYGEIKESDEYTIKLRQRLHKVKDLSQYPNLVVEPSPEDRLSITTRRIPLINSSDSVRVAMGSKMSEQAIEIEKSEPALISSGNDDLDYQISSRIVKYQGNGAKVEKISGNKIIYRDIETGSLNYYEIPQPTLGQTGAVISYIMKVSEGDTLHNGDDIIIPKIMKSGGYELGLNARCFYMNYLGYTHEDGIVISESFSRKLTSYNITEVTLHVSKNQLIEYLAPLGSRTSSLDILVKCSKIFTDEDRIQGVFIQGNLMSGLGLDRISNNLTTPNNIEIGYVIGIKIQINPKVRSDQESTNECLDKFINANVISSDWDAVPERYHNLEITDKEFYSKDAFIITYKLIRVRPAIIGSKLCNRYGSKGEVSLILPDELMPRIKKEDGTEVVAEILLNPPAIVARKNPSQLYEALLTKLIFKIHDGALKLFKEGKINEAKEYTRPLYDNFFTTMDDDEFEEALSNFKQNFRLELGSYSKLDINKITSLCEEFGIKETDQVYCPDITIGEGEHGVTAISPDKINQVNLKDAKTFELGWLESEVITGDTYFMKLFHSADYVGKVTSSTAINEPLMGKGSSRSEGQKIGEMELWSLLSYGTARKFLMDQSETKLTSQYEFLNHLMLAGYTIVDDDELPLMSNYRTNVHKLKDIYKK